MPTAPAPLVKSTAAKTGNERPVSMKLDPNAKSAAPAGTSAGFTNLNRGAIAPARILGAALKIYGDYLKQVIVGVDMSFSLLTLPSELISAFNEVDSYISAAHFPVQAVSSTVSTLTNPMRLDNRAYDAVAGNILVNPLREPFHRDALQEVYELYNAMEFIMKREAAAVLAAAAAASGVAGGAGTTLSTRVPFGPMGGKNNVRFVSPYLGKFTTSRTLLTAVFTCPFL
jgi:hypothetical protein